ncbi:MAG: hypothetical protein ABIZ91_18100, partial [Gemmatimonadaceae bacterium]
MQPDLEALLSLQTEDDVVGGLVVRLEALEPRLSALDVERERVAKHLESSRAQVDAGDAKRREMELLVSEHRQRQERNVAQLDLVKNMREATAATAQVEAGRKMLADGENEVRDLTSRLAAARQSIEEQQQALSALDGAQATARTEIGLERNGLEAELRTARARRDETAARVDASLLSKYDRIRSRRRSQTVFSLADGACGACDTALPVQRGKQMATRGSIEVCEG